MTNEQLSKELGRHRMLAAAGRLLSFASIAEILVCIFMQEIWFILLGIIAGGIGTCLERKHREAVKHMLGDEVIGGVLREMLEQVEYQPFGHLPEAAVKDSHLELPFGYDRIKGSDYVRAVYRGLNIEFSDIELFQVESTWDEEMNNWKENEKRVFQGQWLVCDYGRELSAEVKLMPRTNEALRRRFKGQDIQTGHEMFDRRFILISENGQEARNFFSPRRMDFLLAMADKSGGEVYLSLQQSGRLNIAVQSGRNFFELGRGEVDITQLRSNFIGEVRWFTDVIEQMNPEDIGFMVQAQGISGGIQ